MSGFCKHPHAKANSLITEDDAKVEVQEETNPFSFKEFVKSKARPAATITQCDGGYPKRIPESCGRSGLKYEETFFKDPTVIENLVDEEEDDDDDEEEEEEEDWSTSYHPSVIEHTHNPKPYSLPFAGYDESYNYSDVSAGEPFNAQRLHGRVSPSSEGCPSQIEPLLDSTSNSVDDLRFQTLQINYEEVQEENSCLKRQILELTERNKIQTEKVKHLEWRLERKILEEQKEAQDLESMVQQVEKNLQTMTKRAAKAEGNVTKLKQEVALLQVQLNTYKAENEALRRGETAAMNTVKHNASLALENLHKVVSGAQSSIKQLMSGAESMNLVAELLRSIDRIAEVHENDVP
ncbi:endosome-associated-trafficking regulator 1 [Spea bombifrons]|uniref:endosome-associated-trafficking regulator 1 n=1 Tax=Spea bombifrons TaxID=233779 RepID=UPI00234B0E98|nr:endosome-associated-trafficking regulator 1 [Spea bombifrons]